MLYTPYAPVTPPPTYDNSAISSIQSAHGSGVAFSPAAQTVTAGAYGIVAVFFNSGGMNLGDLATAVVTFGGQTLSNLGWVYVSGATTGGIWVFGGPNIAGGSQTASITLTQAGKSFSGYGASFTYNNVTSVGRLNTRAASNNASQTVVTSGVGSLVWGAVDDSASNTFSAGTFTTRQGNNTTTAPTWIAGDQAGAANTVCGATMSASFTWGAVGLNLIWN